MEELNTIIKGSGVAIIGTIVIVILVVVLIFLYRFARKVK